METSTTTTRTLRSNHQLILYASLQLVLNLGPAGLVIAALDLQLGEAFIRGAFASEPCLGLHGQKLGSVAAVRLELQRAGRVARINAQNRPQNAVLLHLGRAWRGNSKVILLVSLLFTIIPNEG